MNRVQTYRPLGRLNEQQRDDLLRGALAMLAEDMTLVDVAAHYNISKSTLLAALTTYAEDEWKTLQVARAQVAVQRASQKRMEIAAQLDEYQAAEKKGAKTTETPLTYPRIREQLRIAEHDEKSAQWHLERLHKRLYGNSVAMTIEPQPFEPDRELLASVDRLLKEASEAADRMPSDAEKEAIVKFVNEHPEVWDANIICQLTRAGAQRIGGKWVVPPKPITGEVISVDITPQPIAPDTDKNG